MKLIKLFFVALCAFGLTSCWMHKDNKGIYDIHIVVYFVNGTEHPLSLSLNASKPIDAKNFNIAPGKSAVIRSYLADSREDLIFENRNSILLVDKETGCEVTYKMKDPCCKSTLFYRSEYEQEKLSDRSYNYTYTFTEKDFEGASCK